MNENYKLTNAQNMKKLILLPYLFLLGLLLQAQTETLYPWTDTQGRTLQASFISLDSGKVTINWNGQIVPIPLTNLSPETQALAKKLATESLKLPTPVAASNSSGIYPFLHPLYKKN